MKKITLSDFPVAVVPASVTTFDQLRDFERETCSEHGAFLRPVCHVDLEYLPDAPRVIREGFVAQKFDFCLIQQIRPGERKREYFHGRRLTKGGKPV